MASKLKKLKDLEHKLIVSVPVENYKKKYGKKLSKIKSTPKIDGFRKGFIGYSDTNVTIGIVVCFVLNIILFIDFKFLWFL